MEELQLAIRDIIRITVLQTARNVFRRADKRIEQNEYVFEMLIFES